MYMRDAYMRDDRDMASVVSPRPEDGPAACAAEALRLLRAHAYFADRVDWAAATRKVEQAIAAGTDLGQALRPVFRALRDRHSYLRPANWPPGKVTNLPSGYRSAPGVGYLRLPSFPVSHGAPVALDYVQSAWALLRHMSPADGWVVDLQGNTGGSIVPMLTAIGPLLGRGPWLRYRRRDGHELTYWYAAGELRADGHPMLAVPQPPPDTPHLPVAILTDASTASAAEGVLVAFRGRARTRSFGQPTAGMSTGNAGYPLGDGSLLLIARSVAVDRCGRSYATALVPDADAGPAAAHAWLSAEPHH
jgi:carboxyl-terminal processing protease